MLFLYLMTASLGTLLFSLCGVFGVLLPYASAQEIVLWGAKTPTPFTVRLAHFTTGFFAVLILAFPYIYTLFWVEGTSRAFRKKLQEKKRRSEENALKEARSRFQGLAIFSLSMVVLGLLSGGATRNNLPTFAHYGMIFWAYLQNLYGLMVIGDRLIDYILLLERIEKTL